MERRQHQNLQNEGFSAVGNHSMRDGLGSNREAGTEQQATWQRVDKKYIIEFHIPCNHLILQDLFSPPLLLLGILDHLQLENMIGFELFARLYIFNLHLNIQLNRWRWMIAATFCNICRSFIFFTANTNCVSASCTIFATWSWAIPLIHKKCTPQAILTKKGTYQRR